MKKKIILVGPIPPPKGGIAKYVCHLYESSYLQEKFNLNLFNTATPKEVRRYEKPNERSYLSFLSDGLIPGLKLIKYVLFNFFSFIKVVKLKKPVIVQVFTSSFWGFWRSSILILIAKYYNIKVIFSLLNAIDNFWEESSFISRQMIKYMLNRCDYILVQSEGIKTFVDKITGTTVLAIYNGIDLKDYENFSYKNSGNSKRKKQIVFVGALTKNKGVYDLMDAYKIINDDSINYIFIGSGDIDGLKKFGNKNGISNQLMFKGNISDEEKIKILKESYIFVLPSYAEGQPLAILEAMCSGLPIISTNVGSIPEIIKDGVNGYIVEPGDIQNLSNKIRYLIENENECRDISKNNYVTGRNLYNIERLFLETSEVYNQL